MINRQTSEIVPRAEQEPQRVAAEDSRNFSYFKPVCLDMAATLEKSDKGALAA